MAQTDPVSDMIAMIKNALQRGLKRLSVRHSKQKDALAKVLKAEGYLEEVKTTYETSLGPKGKLLHLYLKYDSDNRSVLTEIRRISKPGKRVFVGVDKLPRVLDGLGISVLSTSKGIMSDKQARKDRVGGEILCKVW